VTWSPAGLGLTTSIDYYRITLDDAISTIPGTFLFEQCLDTGNPLYCSQIRRTSLGALTGASVASGGYILQTSVNVAAASLEGIDVQLSYSLPLSERWGALSFALNGANVLSADNTPQPGSGQSYDCAGLFGTTCQTITPKWRHNVRIGWETPWDLEVSLNWRYIGRTSLDGNSTDPDLNPNGDIDEFNAELPVRNYFDLSALWNFATGTTVRLGINNILDKDPPLISTNVSGTGGPNSYPTYDILGRQAFLGVTQRF
jgi:iron complex outermembrane recepter protein